jgi:hypothetical protein
MEEGRETPTGRQMTSKRGCIVELLANLHWFMIINIK